MTAGIELAADLIRSRIRVEVLRRLQEGEMTKYDLREQLDCSRTTVDRNLAQLEADGWIAKNERGYEITTGGEIALERATDFVETVDAATRLRPILRWIPRAELDIDLRHLTDASVTRAGEATPLAMVDRHVASIKACSTFQSLLPITSAQPYEVQYRRIVEGAMTGEHVVSPTVAEVFLTDPQFRDMTAELRERDEFTVFVTDEEIPYYLGILDETVQIGVAENGEPRGLLETDNEAVREWAETKIDAYRASAVPLEQWESA